MLISAGRFRKCFPVKSGKQRSKSRCYLKGRDIAQNSFKRKELLPRSQQVSTNSSLHCFHSFQSLCSYYLAFSCISDMHTLQYEKDLLCLILSLQKCFKMSHLQALLSQFSVHNHCDKVILILGFILPLLEDEKILLQQVLVDAQLAKLRSIQE